jgi:predicted LPLAT superfamily acyltransferase
MNLPPQSPPKTSPTWLQQKERGSAMLMRVMTWLSLTLGRRLTRPLVYVIAAYFLLTSPRARAASRDYLNRALGHPASWRDLYRHFLSFACTVHDRVYLLNDKHAQFKITSSGHEQLRYPNLQERGAIVLGAHMGSFEVMRAVSDTLLQRPVYAAMYPDNAAMLNSLLSRVNHEVMSSIIPLGQVDSFMRLQQHLDEGHLVALLADRAAGPVTHLSVPFFGTPAPFPTGAFRLAALMRRPVYYVGGFYEGDNRYHIVHVPLADFSQIETGQRQKAIQAAIERYAQILEQHGRKYPYNWFNFYDFWHSHPHDTP